MRSWGVDLEDKIFSWASKFFRYSSVSRWPLVVVELVELPIPPPPPPSFLNIGASREGEKGEKEEDVKDESMSSKSFSMAESEDRWVVEKVDGVDVVGAALVKAERLFEIVGEVFHERLFLNSRNP